VVDEHVYVDDRISGAEFVKRPGFFRLMNALKPRAPFQALVMVEEFRLGREQIETAYALKQIIDAGVRVFFYLEDRERTLDSATDKFMLSAVSFAGELEREKAKQRTYDAMRAKAERGHVAGGIVYGYDNVRVGDHIERRVNEPEAAVIRRRLQLTAAGQGLVRIAKTLTAEGIVPPRETRQAHGWAASCIRDMLSRELYRGRIVWNKMRRLDRGGTRTKVRRPESEWLTREAPELRIVSDESWRAAHEVLDQKARCPGQKPHRRSHHLGLTLLASA
jgi:site-specific DNA recombinase